MGETDENESLFCSLCVTLGQRSVESHAKVLLSFRRGGDGPKSMLQGGGRHRIIMASLHTATVGRKYGPKCEAAIGRGVFSSVYHCKGLKDGVPGWEARFRDEMYAVCCRTARTMPSS